MLFCFRLAGDRHRAVGAFISASSPAACFSTFALLASPFLGFLIFLMSLGRVSLMIQKAAALAENRGWDFDILSPSRLAVANFPPPAGAFTIYVEHSFASSTGVAWVCGA